ncbi:MAG: hydantoinase B/oxoprolinase family protein, partial [Planctomycetota bacterium]
ASAGTMNNLSFGGAQLDGEGGSFTHYETHGGGAGGGPRLGGAHAVQTHMTNTRNTPVEALENELPVRVLRQTVRRGTGGEGARPGGDGLVRRLSFLTDVRLSWMAERQRCAPFGVKGGASGAPGEAWVRRPGDEADHRLTPKAALDLPAGSEVEIRTPGGGGHGQGRQEPSPGDRAVGGTD